MHLNSHDTLPPVDCPLLIEVDGKLTRATRTCFVENKTAELRYQLEDGTIITGRYRWTYP